MLATALYLVAAEPGTDPADATRDQVETLARRQDGEGAGDTVRRWEERLVALGHDLADGRDPVSARWRVLRTDNSPADRHADALDDPHALDEDVLHRQGRGVVEGLDYVLSADLGLRF
ncbi:hypothetical protein ABZW10_33710 [Kitasatospora sp. NPDC004723]|uniref:hypothetical protein n=1 Tax=Kitasatospora sp. NPDC004723 TaxID=3154288 RepID=UPI0033A681D0